MRNVTFYMSFFCAFHHEIACNNSSAPDLPASSNDHCHPGGHGYDKHGRCSIRDPAQQAIYLVFTKLTSAPASAASSGLSLRALAHSGWCASRV